MPMYTSEALSLTACNVKAEFVLPRLFKHPEAMQNIGMEKLSALLFFVINITFSLNIFMPS